MNRKWIKITVALLVVALLAGLAVVRLRPKENVFPPLPNPNGFHLLVAAVGMATDVPWNYRELPVASLQAIADTNLPAIKQVEQGLQLHSRIVHSFGPDYFDKRMTEIRGSKNLAHILSVASLASAAEGRPNQAADYALLAIRFGHEAFRGGVMIDRLVGNACESIGLGRLETLTNALTAEHCRHVARTLETVDRERETTEQVLKNEKLWSRAQPWNERLRYMWEIKSLSPDKVAYESFVEPCAEQDQERREIMLLFAARAYELERGTPPLRAADLVPNYLQAVPKDPETGLDMELKR